MQDPIPQRLTLETAVEAAIKFDPWLLGNRHQQDSIESLSVAAGTMVDPKVSLGIVNIASDSFDFNQEAMTQFKVSVSQMFPRGDSLSMKKQRLGFLAEQYPYLRENRKGIVSVLVSQLWLDAFNTQQSILLIEKNRSLFEQLADVAQASYASTIGKTRQQDIVRAQLELTRLDDRLTVLKQKKEIYLEKLSEWINNNLLINSSFRNEDPNSWLIRIFQMELNRELPKIKMLLPELYLSRMAMTQQKVFENLAAHPSLLAVEKKIQASESSISIAKQNYKPEWGINAGYGYRADDVSSLNSTAHNRSDLFSIGISFDLPLFTSNRQDMQLNSAVSKTEAIKTEKTLLARKMIANFESYRAQLLRLKERQNLYQNQLLPQMHDQAEASLTAYTNDDGDFAEVIRSRIAELNARIDYIGIDVEKQKTILQLNYIFMKSADQIVIQDTQLVSDVENRSNKKFGLGELK